MHTCNAEYYRTGPELLPNTYILTCDGRNIEKKYPTFFLWRLHSESFVRDLPALLDLGVQRLVCGLVGRVLVSPVTQGRVTLVSVLQSPDKIILKSLLR